MKKKIIFLCVSVALVAVIVNLSFTGATDVVEISSHEDGVVTKARGDDFTVKVTFKNTGNSDGTWTVTPVFEGESWTWKGTAQTLTLNAGSTKTLTWNGVVPNGAALNSVARLVVYYDDSFKALDWWIRVASNAELAIQSSTVQ